MDPSSDFQKCIVEYLESVHKQEIHGGSFEDIQAQCQDAQKTTQNTKIQPILCLYLHRLSARIEDAINV